MQKPTPKPITTANNAAATYIQPSSPDGAAAGSTGGVDSEYYKGLYGPWFKDASVVIHETTFTFAPTATPAPSAPTLKPTFQPTTKYKSEFWDDGYYGYYGGDDKAAAAALSSPP